MRVSAGMPVNTRASATSDAPLRALIDILPRPIRFLGVGGVGLFTDLTIFTLLLSHAPHPLVARLVSLAAATLVTWRFNRTLTFARSGRGVADEAARYAAVAGCAQAVSYGIFAALIVMSPAMMGSAMLPQLAVLAGAAAGAAVSYAGQLCFAFRPRRPALGAP
jgi:putative flippase GtrA